MKKPGIFGNTEASTTRRFSTPRTRKSLSSTAFSSSSVPIGHVHEAWCPQALCLTNSRICLRLWTSLPGRCSFAIRSSYSAVMPRTNSTPSTTDSTSSSDSSVPSSKYLKLMSGVSLGSVERRPYIAAAVVGVGFEDRPCQRVEVLGKLLRVPWEVALEPAEESRR